MPMNTETKTIDCNCGPACDCGPSCNCKAVTTQCGCGQECGCGNSCHCTLEQTPSCDCAG